jgi:hypothetical protein
MAEDSASGKSKASRKAVWPVKSATGNADNEPFGRFAFFCARTHFAGRCCQLGCPSNREDRLASEPLPTACPARLGAAAGRERGGGNQAAKKISRGPLTAYRGFVKSEARHLAVRQAVQPAAKRIFGNLVSKAYLDSATL